MKLIDKDALVAEIERIKNICQGVANANEDNEFTHLYYCGKTEAYSEMAELIDTLEVKEVDFDTEIYDYIDEHFNVYDDGNQTLQTKDKNSLIGRVDVENIAKHFFELGLKAQKGEEV